MLLATDLDGTFLGGRQADRLKLYRLIREQEKIRLLFVTGRGIESVMPLLDNPVIPDPDYIICDVGATVLNGQTLEPVQPIQSEIERRWPGALRPSRRGPARGGATRSTCPRPARAARRRCRPRT